MLTNTWEKNLEAILTLPCFKEEKYFRRPRDLIKNITDLFEPFSVQNLYFPAI